MSRGSNRLYSLIAVALMVFCVGAATKAAILSETDPSWQSVDEIRTFDVESHFAAVGSVYPDLYAANVDGPVNTQSTTSLHPEVQQPAILIVAPTDMNCPGDRSTARV